MPPPKRPKVQECQKHVWLITYTVCSPDITAEMLLEAGVECNECYTLSWRESKYTLIHLSKTARVRSTLLQKTMKALETSHNIKQSEIVGFDSLSSNTKDSHTIKEHPGFMRMIQIANEKPEDLRAWLKEGTITTNNKGILFKYIEAADQTQMTRGQLIEKITKQEAKIKKLEEYKAEVEILRSTLTVREREILETRQYNTQLVDQLADKMDECTAMKQRLIQHKIDHTWTKESTRGTSFDP